MSSASSTPPPPLSVPGGLPLRPGRGGSRVKKAAWAGILLLPGILAVLRFRQPLERPWADLEPAPLPAVAGEQNGYLWLRDQWSALPPPDKATTAKLTACEDGRIPWDESDPGIQRLLADGGSRLAELEHALAFPGWQAPVPVRLDDPPGMWETAQHASIRALILQHIAGGRLPEAVAALQVRHAAARRSGEHPPSGRHWLMSRGTTLSVLAVMPDLLTRVKPENEALLLGLQRICEDEWLTAGALSWCGRTQAMLMKSEILSAVPSRDLNTLHDALLAGDSLWLRPRTPSDSLHVLAETFRSENHWKRWVGSVSAGRALADETITSWGTADTFARQALFQQRAANVRIALIRWRAAQGNFPASLTDLVPACLKAVPLDPFDGKPLRWDAARYGGLIYSVGFDVTDDPSQAFRNAEPTDWTSGERDCPAARMERRSGSGPLAPSREIP